MTIRTALAAFLMLSIGCGAANAEFRDITVDGQTITKAAQERLAREAVRVSGNPQATERPGFEDDIRRLAVERAVLANAARRQGLDRKADVQEEIRRKVNKETDGPEEIRDKVETILANRAVNAYASAHPVTEAEAKAEYERRRAAFRVTEVQVDHILVATREEAEKIIAELEKGADFGRLAKEKSLDRASAGDGGAISWRPADDFTPELAEAVKGLRKGELCREPIPSPAGFHVVKLAGTRAAKFPSFGETEAAIMLGLLRERVSAWVNGEVARAKVVQ
jgi:peptidyl-prolyl cis-trans isomerase C